MNDFEKIVEEQGEKFGSSWADKLKLADEAIKFGWTSADQLDLKGHADPRPLRQAHAHKFAELVISQMRTEHENHAKKMAVLGGQTFTRKILAALLKGANVATTVVMQALMPEERRDASSVRYRSASSGGAGDRPSEGGAAKDPSGDNPGHEGGEA